MMTLKPLSSADPRTPPQHPVRWRGTAGTRVAEVEARTWFEARGALMAQLGVGPGEIVVKPVEDDEGSTNA